MSSVDSWPSMNLHTENICKTSQPITTPSRSFMTVDLLRRTPGLPYMLVSRCALICNGSDTEGGHRVITKRRQKCSQRPDASRTLRLETVKQWSNQILKFGLDTWKVIGDPLCSLACCAGKGSKPREVIRCRLGLGRKGLGSRAGASRRDLVLSWWSTNV